MPDWVQAALPYIFLALIAAAVTSWANPITAAGCQALFTACFAALSALWLLVRGIASRRR